MQEHHSYESSSFQNVYYVKIQYAKIDNISIQFNFTTIAYAGSLKETKSQDIHKFILGNPLGEGNATKFLLIADMSLSPSILCPIDK